MRKHPKNSPARLGAALAQALPPSDRSRWAYCMAGRNPDIDDAEAVARISKAFGRKHPAWIIASNPARKVTGEAFRTLRESVLRLTRLQAATYLRVSARAVGTWESGKAPVPFAAFEALRLLSESREFRLSHPMWDGWFMNPQTGELVSPDVGKLAVLPEEISGLPRLYAERDMHKRTAEKLRKELEALTAENTRLRKLFAADGVTDELRSMQDHLAGLLERIATARVLDFPAPAGATHKPRKVTAR